MIGFVVLLLASLLTFLVSAVVLVRALRGYRVGDHPHCRSCEFDLFGLPDGSTRCPECGADLTRPNPTHLGQRHVRHRTVYLSGAAVALSLLLMSSPLTSLVAGFDFDDYKPAGWLVSDLRDPSEAVRAKSFQAIQTRLRADRNRDALVAGARGIITSKRRPNQTELAFIEALRTQKWLTPDDLHQLLDRLARFDVLLRPMIRAGDPIPIRIVPKPDPDVLMFGPRRIYYTFLTSATIRLPDSDLEPIGLITASGRQLIQMGWDGRVFGRDITGIPPEGSMIRLRPGKYRVLLTMRMSHRPGSGNVLGKDIVATTTHESWHEVEVLPAGLKVVKPVNDEETVRAARLSARVTVIPSARGRIFMVEPVGAVPVTIAADVFHRIGTTETQLGTVLIPAYRRPTTRGTTTIGAGPFLFRSAATQPTTRSATSPSNGYLILRPNPDVVLSEFDYDTYLDAELWFDPDQDPPMPTVPR